MPAGKLSPNEIPERLWQHILVDFITKLPISQCYNLILVVYDRFFENIILCSNNRENNSRSVKFTNSGLSFSLFYFSFSFYFHFIFLFFYF